MNTGNFETGTIIKGRDLKGYTLCKVLSEDMCMRDFQYQLGINEDVKPFAKSGRCREGLYFITMGEVLKYLHHGMKLAVITIPANEDVYVDDGKFRTHKLTVRKIMNLGDVATWKYLHRHGIDFNAEHNMALRYAVYNGYLEVLMYLHKHGVDIAVNDNFTIKVAAQQGHLEIVKYLHQHNVDITMDNNSIIKWALFKKHMDIVNYLSDNGVDFTAKNCMII